ncbi:macrophage mannose receptor 1b [Hypomesus transpacificus]|uniref:macrophage mannose receptor 1b n=1 Tax=Hypomesus transpacificus TaxID=137520 RepID=UPI001F086BE4|nr:macrophage mannose receptor 1b [Hypomesus transpacificus]
MLTVRIVLAVSVLHIQSWMGACLSDDKFSLQNVGTQACMGALGKRCVDLRWASNGRILLLSSNKCLGAQGKTEGSALGWYDCDETSELQQWECNNTLVALKGQKLFIRSSSNSNLVLSKDMGSQSQFVITGTSDGPCSRTHREYFTISGNANGRPCQFPFYYKSKVFGGCTTFDSSIKRAWCSVTTKYTDELWGYCPTTSTAYWTKNPVTNEFYQLNPQSALTWHQARQSCQQQESDLVSVSEPHEHAYIAGLLGNVKQKLWIGLNSLDQESGWQWSSGRPLSYLRWEAGNPQPNPGHSCVLMDSEVQSDWQSSLCTKKLGYVCQKHKTQPPVDPVDQGFCTAPWIPYTGHCFQLHRDQKTWLEARNQCRKEGGGLAALHNIEEQSFVISQLGYRVDDMLWIGLNDHKTDLLFEWSDQSSVRFTHWSVGEPAHSQRRKHCVLINGAEGKWSDAACENKHGFVCKANSAPKPSGGTVETNPGCKPGWRRHGSHCYLTGAEVKTFEEAKEACSSSGSFLADVPNGIDNAFLVSLVGRRSEKHFWIGLSNKKNYEFFEWTTNQVATYTHWNAGMPGRLQGCVAISTGIVAGLWDVLSCTNKEKYICKLLAEGVVSTVAPATPVPSSCEEDWTPVGNRHMCSKFFTGPRSGEKTWFEARDYCRAIGGDLLSIHSNLDEASIHRRGKAWVGLSALDPQTGWSWSDESPLNFQNWMDGEPNSHMGMELCVEHHYGDEGQWNDIHCESYNDWFCQIQKGVIPHPPPNDTIADYNSTEDGWLLYKGYQYYINHDAAHMQEARKFCRDKHGDLATINGEEENIFLWKQIAREYGDYYIGLSVDYDSSFGWMDGSPLVFQRWYQEFPSFKSFDENCVLMTNSMGFWQNVNCGTEMKSFCKRRTTPPVNSTVAPTTPPRGRCPANWRHFRSKCYKVVTSPESWHEARVRCREMAGNLASVITRQVQVFLMSMSSGRSMDLWIGLTMSGRDQFLWTDSQPCKYANWAEGQPDSYYWRWSRRFYSVENECVVISSGPSSGKWVTRNCNDTNSYICQRPLDTNLPPDQPTPYPKTPIKLGNDSYQVVTQRMNWMDAKRQCERQSFQLASILNEEAQAFVELQVMKLNAPLWIGLNKEETGGYFRWIDNWLLKLTHWGAGEPAKRNPCVYIDEDGKWKTSLCNQTYFSVCKQSTDTPPELPEQFEGVCTAEEDGPGELPWKSPVSWIPFRGHCYSFSLDDEAWNSAMMDCISLGASMVSIENPDEQAFIKNHIEIFKDTRTSFWLGLYKTVTGKWLWIDKSVMDYTNWDEDSTDNEYGQISASGLWSTEHRWATAGHICKKAKVPLQISNPTNAPNLEGNHSTHAGIVVAVVLIVLSLVGVGVFIIYKRSGRSLTIPFENPLYFNQGRFKDNVVDSNKLIED